MVGAAALRPGAVRGWGSRSADARGAQPQIMKRSRCRDRPQPPPPAGRREDGAQRAVELPQPQPLPPRRRAPPGRQLLEERTGLSGPEVREQVRGPDDVREGKDGEREPEWEQWGRGSQAGRLGPGHLRGGDCVVCGEKRKVWKGRKMGSGEMEVMAWG